MKKLLALILSLIMVISLLNFTVAETLSYSGKTLTVGIWGGNDQETASINQVVSDFESLTGAKVELKVYTDYNTQIQADFIGGTAPDAFYIDANVFPFYAKMGVMEALDPAEMNAEAFYSNLVAAFTDDEGKLYCMAKDNSTLALYYNDGILQSVGISKDAIPTAYEDFEPFLADLQAKLDEKYGKDAVAAMSYNQDMARNLYLLQNGGVSICAEDSKVNLTSPETVEALDFILNLAKKGLWRTPSDLGTGWNGEAFGVEKTALMEEGNWVYGYLKSSFPDVKFGVLPMPSYKGEVKSMVFTVGYGIGVNSQNKDLAKEWIKYATGVDGMATWCAGTGTLPSRADVAKKIKIANDPALKIHSQMTEVAVPWQMGTSATIINTAFQNHMPMAVSGSQTALEMLQTAQDQANSEIENAF